MTSDFEGRVPSYIECMVPTGLPEILLWGSSFGEIRTPWYSKFLPMSGWSQGGFVKSGCGTGHPKDF